MRRALLLAAAAGVCVHSIPAAAQNNLTYPGKPIRLLVPFSAGGGIDLLARITAERLGEALGQTVYVENQAGGGGLIASRMVANAPADGYTLIFHSASSAVVNLQSPKILGYDPAKDFAPVALVAQFPLVLLTNPTVPAKDLKEFIALVRANPTKFSYGSSGTGTAIHLATELFLSMAGIKMQHVPYKGTSAALADLLGARIELLIDGVPPELGNIASGRVRALAVTTKTRSDKLPAVPSLAESGFPAYNLPFWVGIFAPGKTPKEVIAKVSSTLARVVKDPKVQAQFREAGADAIGSTPEQLDQFSKEQIAVYSNVAREARVNLNER